MGKGGGFKYGERGCGCKAAGKSDQISDSQILANPTWLILPGRGKSSCPCRGGPHEQHSAPTHLGGQCSGIFLRSAKAQFLIGWIRGQNKPNHAKTAFGIFSCSGTSPLHPTSATDARLPLFARVHRRTKVALQRSASRTAI